jgi:PASTA domain
MSMPPGEGGGGGIMSSRILGIPTLVWVAIAALGAYYLFFRNKSGATAGGTSSAGSSDTLTGGTTTVDSGAVQVSVNSSGSNTAADNSGAAAAPTGTATAGSGSPSVTTTNGGQPTPPAPPPVQTVTTATPAPPAPSQTAANISVPNVVGQRANFGIGELTSSGLGYKSTTGNRKQADTYAIATQSPAPGTKVSKGSIINIGFKDLSTG